MALPILSTAQMRDWERESWTSGIREADVIARVGSALAAHLRRVTRPGGQILLLAGKGHNGDDVRAAQLPLAGQKVELISVKDPATDLPRVRDALGRRPDWVVDGLFGIGLDRPLDPDWCALITTVNDSGARVLAMDVPSGLDADTGALWGAGIRATATFTVGAPKRGLLVAPAVPYVGRLEIATDVGLLAPMPALEESAVSGWWSEAGDFADWPPRRRADAHKGDFGQVAIVAGSSGYHGAAVLAARGALRARPGLVSVFTTPATYLPVAAQLAAAMVHSGIPGTALPARTTALVVGPGLAHPDAMALWKEALQEWWALFPGPLVVDASALDWLPVGVRQPGGIRVITPHPGEAGRLLGVTSAAVQSDRPAAVRALSARLGGCWVVLKGHQTLVGRETGPCWWNGSGNPGLAQGGSGDVLSGFLGGTLAQREMAANPLRAIRSAVWHHGATADRLERSGDPWTAEDLAAQLKVET